MITLFRISLFICLAFLVFLGWFLIFIGFHIISLNIISPFIDYKIATLGFFIWILVLFLFSLEKRVFYSEEGIDIEGKHGSIRITKSAIIDLISGIEIDGVDELVAKVSIRHNTVDLKISATCFSSYVENIPEGINMAIDEVMKGLLITNYKKTVYINHIKKGRRLM